MINEAGIDFRALEDEKMDDPLGASTGGVMEAALRTAYEIVTGRELPFDKLHVTPVQGLEGVKEASVTITGTVPAWSFLEGVTMNVAVAHGLANARTVIEKMKAGEANYHFIEVMTCPGGCIGGGGQPRLTTDEVRKARMAAIYREDEGRVLRKSHDNPVVEAMIPSDNLSASAGDSRVDWRVHRVHALRPRDVAWRGASAPAPRGVSSNRRTGFTGRARPSGSAQARVRTQSLRSVHSAPW